MIDHEVPPRVGACAAAVVVAGSVPAVTVGAEEVELSSSPQPAATATTSNTQGMRNLAIMPEATATNRSLVGEDPIEIDIFPLTVSEGTLVQEFPGAGIKRAVGRSRQPGTNAHSGDTDLLEDIDGEAR